jgi:hypothetical protein
MLLLRNSERSSFKRCRHQWQWTYRDGRQAREAPRALRFGDLVHQALAIYRPPGIKFGPHPAKTFERLYMEQATKLEDEGFNVWSDEAWVDALDLGKAMLSGYVERYQSEDSQYRVLATEQTFQLLVRAPIPADWAGPVPPSIRSGRRHIRFKVVGTFDGVWQHRKNKRISFKEYKTAARITEDGLAMDEQAGLYWTYGPKWLQQQGILKPDQMPSDILYTFLRKAMPDPDAVTDAEGRLLKKPTKAALLEAYNILKRELPARRDGKPGAPLVDDLIADLADNTDLDPLQLGEVASNQPSNLFHRLPVYRDTGDRERVHARVLAEAVDIARGRDGTLALYKNPGPLHLPNCRFCAVREACEVHEAKGDWKPVLDSLTVPWNPYAAHELPERS